MRFLVVTTIFITILAFSHCLYAGSAFLDGPYVVSTTPESGASNVSPNLKQIIITFNEAMKTDRYSVVGGGENFPQLVNFGFRKGGKVFVMNVKLKPNWEYGFGVNSKNHKNFQNLKGVPVKPVWISFKTGAKGDDKEEDNNDATLSFGKIEFSMHDGNGLVVNSADYEGSPLFITFGPAW